MFVIPYMIGTSCYREFPYPEFSLCRSKKYSHGPRSSETATRTNEAILLLLKIRSMNIIELYLLLFILIKDFFYHIVLLILLILLLLLLLHNLLLRNIQLNLLELILQQYETMLNHNKSRLKKSISYNDSLGRPSAVIKDPELWNKIHESVEFGAAHAKRRKVVIKVRTIKHLRETLEEKYNTYLSHQCLSTYLQPVTKIPILHVVIIIRQKLVLPL